MLNTIQSTLYSHNKARKRKIAKRSKMGSSPLLASFQEEEGRYSGNIRRTTNRLFGHLRSNNLHENKDEQLLPT